LFFTLYQVGLERMANDSFYLTKVSFNRW